MRMVSGVALVARVGHHQWWLVWCPRAWSASPTGATMGVWNGPAPVFYQTSFSTAGNGPPSREETVVVHGWSIDGATTRELGATGRLASCHVFVPAARHSNPQVESMANLFGVIGGFVGWMHHWSSWLQSFLTRIDTHWTSLFLNLCGWIPEMHRFVAER